MRALLVALVMVAGASRAQDVLPGDGTGEVETSRRAEGLLETPLSLSVVERDEMLRGRSALGLEDALVGVPGVFAQSAPNFAQDTRVSIRGYGARASFGIRGIRVYVDGVPTTLADGQSEVDSIDLAFAERLEVLRGPVSSLWGGGGGGVLSLSTVEPTAEPTLRLRTLFGSHHLSRHEAVATGRAGPVGYAAGLAYTRLTGYRDHARTRQHTAFAKLEGELPDRTRVRGLFSGVWAPEADDPGGLNQSEVDEDRTQARLAAHRFDTGERLDQQRYAIDVTRPLPRDQQVRLVGYYLKRDFRNRLPFESRGWNHFNRDAGGGSLTYRGERGRLAWLAGVDASLQRDPRERWENLSGSRGALQLDQTEKVRSVGPFAEIDVKLARGFGVVAGVRYDWMEYVCDDHFDGDADQSDRFRYRELSPRVGVYLDRAPRALLYANLLSAFRPPTTTELAVADSGCFQSDVDPERSRGVEVGAKGRLGEWLFYDVAAFYLRVRNAIVPFEDLTGRTLATNAADVRRLGVELGLGARLRPGLELRAAYSFADYRYRDYDRESLASGTVRDFDGNREPNTPRHHLSAELRYEHATGLWAVLGLRYFSDIDVDDANDLESSSATVSDLRVGYDWPWRDLLLRPFAAVRNWSNVEYDGQLRPNAAFGRAFEPAPKAELLAGIELSWGGPL
jgi:iron complex outermembrane receptor protein